MARPIRHAYDFDHDDSESVNSRSRGYQYSSPSPQPYVDTSHVPSPAQFSQAPQYDRSHPAAYPDSSYGLRSQRYPDADYHQVSGRHTPVLGPGYSSSPMVPPVEQRRSPVAHGIPYSQPMQNNSTMTPGMDNLGSAAVGGGITGTAVGFAHSNEREGGHTALRGFHDQGPFRGHSERSPNPLGSDGTYLPSPPEPAEMGTPRSLRGHDSYSSNIALRAAVDVPGQLTPGRGSPHYTPSERSLPVGYYNHSQYTGAGGLYDDPYHRHSLTWGYGVNPEPINPDDILDDGDDGFLPNPRRRSVLSLGRNSSHNSLPTASTGAATGVVTSSTSGLVKNAQTHTDKSGSPSHDSIPQVKSEWLNQQNTGKKKMKWIVGIVVAIIIMGAIAGGVVGGLLASQKKSSGSSKGGGDGGGGQSAGDDLKSNGDLDKNSPEIKSLMKNPNLHKVFPGIDYTAWGTQYPLCLVYPPSQNNVTRDIAVLSQLTNTVRLYGTDCNQTEMVLHAIDKLGLKNMKLWLGVWLDTNTTTNERQLDQLYKIVQATPDKSIFKGAIIGNEVLYRGSATPYATENTLIEHLKSVKANLTALNADMPVATSDLGDKWTAQLAAAVDAVMANVHPFFGGIPVKDAAAWTWTFWKTHNVILTEGTNKPQIISEVGWPSGGGNDCAPFETCPDSASGAIAGVDEMNQFMNDWVCQSLANGTDYFWFEAFDEPWKIQYNEPGKEWEDKWGLMSPDRKLKPGLKIPDCGGKTAS